MIKNFASLNFRCLRCVLQIEFLGRPNSESVRHVSGYKRKTFYPVARRNESPELYYSFKERLEEKNEKLKNKKLFEKVNIGLTDTKNASLSFKERKKLIKESKDSKEMRKKSRQSELFLDLDEAEQDWIHHEKPAYVKAVAENNQIFDHLFGEFAYFNPTVDMNISYGFDDETVSPVYFGNILKPKEADRIPSVLFDSHSSDFWTLILTNPDGNIYDNDSEIVHWFIGNIPGGNIEKGEEIIDYMRPIPFKGTGFHRYVFVLYKQDKRIDFSTFKKQIPCLNLKERTFKTFDFYKTFEDSLTPGGLSWFHSDWDSSLTSFFHNTLNMKEPHYEYEFPKAYIAPQKAFPVRRPFNRYMDMHRDPKELQKLMLIERLNQMHPFDGEIPRPPYPQANPIDDSLAIWIQNEIKEKRDGSGKYRYMYRGDDRPYQFLGKPKTLFAWDKKYNI